ncbi:MAG TPA: hypothetical protein VK487_08465 [Candidatus Bathyarchaeia archaeon]|nr:hypothetical protein [Candidatus Bathyarchaeia archaeon]
MSENLLGSNNALPEPLPPSRRPLRPLPLPSPSPDFGTIQDGLSEEGEI